MAKGEFDVGGVNNNLSTVFGPGTTVRTDVNIADSKEQIARTRPVHGDSTKKVYDAGTANYFGSATVFGKETINGIANLTLQTTGADAGPKYHTSKYGRKMGITAINALTGAVTKTAGSGTRYGMVNGTGTPTDGHVDAVASPYTVPARLTTLGGLGPVVNSYRTAG